MESERREETSPQEVLVPTSRVPALADVAHGHPAPPTLSEPQRRHVAVAAAAKFLGRLSRLAIGDLREPIERWRRAVVTSTEQWFAAESALAHAVARSRRHQEQERLLEQLVETLRGAGWFRHTAAVERIGASEASIQYTSTLAMLALLVRDHLGPAEFSTLYGPFAPLIPLDELGRE